MSREHHARFQRLRYHFRRARGGEALDVGIFCGTNHHRQSRPQLARVMEHTQHQLRIVRGHHHHVGAMDAGSHQTLAPRRIAIGHGFASRRCFAHPLRIEVECHVGDALLFQEARQVLAGLAVTAEYCVLVAADRAGGDLGQGDRAHQPFGGDQAHHDAVAEMDQERQEQQGKY